MTVSTPQPTTPSIAEVGTGPESGAVAVTAAATTPPAIGAPSSRRWSTLIRSPLRRVLGAKSSVVDRVALALAILLVVLAVVGPLYQPYDPYFVAPSEAMRPPSAAHWMGTDDAGRDVFSRLLAGAGTTLLAAILVVLGTTVVGVVLASIAACAPRRVDEAIMRLCDVFLALPTLVLALGIAAALGPSLRSVVIAMVFSMWPGTTRLVRGILHQTMSSTFVEAARTMGGSRLRIMLRHVLPNSLDPVYVNASMDIPGAIVLMAGLSFLGVGAPPPSADWGSMVSLGGEYINSAWWIAVFPGLAITVAAIAFGLTGDALRMRLDPTLRK